ncbi:serine carboxypeptidase 24-like [Euphorbia lathyris]|uniref:serine carboxypeptidase 24-like n=1 Tax=Euphorbia lathyris TaxID=212925 RepID=UPI003313DCF2
MPAWLLHLPLITPISISFSSSSSHLLLLFSSSGYSKMGTHFLFLLVLNIYLLSSIKTIFGLTKEQEQELDRISVLPGQPSVKFSQYSGYVTVNYKHGRALFYWFTEASSSPSHKPLLLWLNGGPGCSSVAYGASEEIGPYRINKTGSSLYLNKHSWNTEANILFLESPAGVGFSYTNTTSDLQNSGDKRTAQDALIFLIRWFSRFPQYKYRDFYIAGESYAGHYVPQLAKKIHDYNKASPHPIINLKGFIVGNGVTDSYYDSIGTVTYWWSHSMISDETYRSIIDNCDFKEDNKTSEKCDDSVSYAINHEFGNIDQYSIYTPACTKQQQQPPNNSSLIKPLLRLKNTLFSRRIFSGYDPCTENYAEKYFNTPQVQQALHANITRIPYKWTACSDILIKNWKDSEYSMLPTYKELIAAGLRIWIFSGDTDSVVPVTATRFSLSHLNLTVKTRWYPWYSGKQVGGWTEVYNGLTFATVRGAGHEVPLFQPKRAFTLFRSFLAGKQLPRS